MPKWLFVVLLLLQSHFAASYLVPLDESSKDAFAGLLRWFWPWEIGDSGVFGELTAAEVPLPGFFLAVTAGSALVLAVLALLGFWIPFHWWRVLVVAGSGMLIVLMLAFIDPTKLLPIGLSLLILWATVTSRVVAGTEMAAGG